MKATIKLDTDTENIQEWYQSAEQWELDFINKFKNDFYIILNPSKQIDKYAPDLYCLKSYVSADLKAQFTPFYSSLQKYGIPPEFAWTFNVSDFFEYLIKWPNDFFIFIWIKYEDLNIERVYCTTIEKIKKYTDKNKIIHKYGKRIYDEKNEKASLIIDLRSPYFNLIYQA